jgi:hypothetical protein
LHKAVSSQSGGPTCLPSKSPSFGSPAVKPHDCLTRGFASPPHDGYAFLGKGLR